jgi:hypothetical protein
MTSMLAALLAAALASTPARPADWAQWRDRVGLGGEVSVMFDGLPRQDAIELRPRAVLEATADLSPSVRVHGELLAEGLVAERDGRTRRDIVIRPDEAWLELTTPTTDLRVGYGTVAWGSLDELQPTDVINPIDTARFLLDGRAAARLPVGFARGRYYIGYRVVLDGVVVPWFRRSTFDELEEGSSPFNLRRDQAAPGEAAGVVGTGADGSIAPAPLPFERREPAAAWSNVSGGGRATVRVARADFSVSAYRGFDAFGAVVFEPAGLPGPGMPPGNTIPGRFVERHERFTMVGGDVEAVAGSWVLRGELAAFDRKLAGVSRAGLVDGTVLEAGAGAERRAGRFRTYGLVLVRRERADLDPLIQRTDVSVVGSIERPFAGDRYLARVFGLANPSDRSGFLRGLLSWDAQDNVTVDVSGAFFVGSGDDLVSRFSDRDFLFVRLGYHF